MRGARKYDNIFLEIRMKNQINVSDRDTKQKAQYNEDQPVISPEKPKANHLLIGVIILVCFVVFGFGAHYLEKQVNKNLATNNQLVVEPTKASNQQQNNPAIVPSSPGSNTNLKTYTNTKYNYQLQYPSGWSVTEQSGTNEIVGPYQYTWFKSPDGNFSFTFGLKYKSESDIRINTRTGTPAGDPVDGDMFMVAGINLYTNKIVYEGKTNTVFFSTKGKDDTYEIEGDFGYIGPDHNFTNKTDLLTTSEYQTVKQIVSSLKFME